MRKNWNSRKPRPPKTPNFDAMGKIADLEEAVVYRTVTIDWTFDQFVRSIFPTDVVDLLRAAHHYIHHSTTRMVNVIQIRSGIKATVVLDTEDYGMPTPNVIPWFRGDTPQAGKIEGVIHTIATIHASFNKVRRSVSWLNEHATPGAARYYCPWLCALLPKEHVVNQISGAHYTEPTASMAPVLQDMREAGGIVTSALFCEKRDVVNKALGLQIHSPNDNPLSGEDAKSQRFMLL
jgi:hypothetical protein